MVGYTLKNVLSEFGSVSRGCGEQDANGFLTSVVERVTIVKQDGKIISKEKEGDRELNPETPTSMNFWGFQPNIFDFSMKLFQDFLKNNQGNLKSEFYIPIIVNELVKEGKEGSKLFQEVIPLGVATRKTGRSFPESGIG
jgi:hypothetical protein